jgi:hypothetical protein
MLEKNFSFFAFKFEECSDTMSLVYFPNMVSQPVKLPTLHVLLTGLKFMSLKVCTERQRDMLFL